MQHSKAQQRQSTEALRDRTREVNPSSLKQIQLSVCYVRAAVADDADQVAECFQNIIKRELRPRGQEVADQWRGASELRHYHLRYMVHYKVL